MVVRQTIRNRAIKELGNTAFIKQCIDTYPFSYGGEIASLRSQ